MLKNRNKPRRRTSSGSWSPELASCPRRVTRRTTQSTLSTPPSLLGLVSDLTEVRRRNWTVCLSRRIQDPTHGLRWVRMTPTRWRMMIVMVFLMEKPDTDFWIWMKQICTSPQSPPIASCCTTGGCWNRGQKCPSMVQLHVTRTRQTRVLAVYVTRAVDLLVGGHVPRVTQPRSRASSAESPCPVWASCVPDVVTEVIIIIFVNGTLRMITVLPTVLVNAKCIINSRQLFYCDLLEDMMLKKLFIWKIL